MATKATRRNTHVKTRLPGDMIELKKVMMNFTTDDSPEFSPVFVNNWQVSHQGDDIFLDAGIIPLDDILAKRQQVRVVVLERLVMSAFTLVQLRDQIEQILESLRKGGKLNAKIQEALDAKTKASLGSASTTIRVPTS
jgi:hypothetical protein